MKTEYTTLMIADALDLMDTESEKNRRRNRYARRRARVAKIRKTNGWEG